MRSLNLAGQSHCVPEKLNESPHLGLGPSGSVLRLSMAASLQGRHVARLWRQPRCTRVVISNLMRCVAVTRTPSQDLGLISSVWLIDRVSTRSLCCSHHEPVRVESMLEWCSLLMMAYRLVSRAATLEQENEKTKERARANSSNLCDDRLLILAMVGFASISALSERIFI